MTLLWVEQKSPEWHALRLNNVGSSEIAGLFSLQAPFGMSAFTLHQVKSGIIPPPPVDDGVGTRIWMGTRLEPVIAQMAGEMFNWEVTYPGPVAQDDTCEGMSASLDGIIEAPSKREREMGFVGPGVLEIKRVEWIAHKRGWEDGEPPPHIVLQVQHAMACSGMTWGVVAALAGEHGLLAYRYAANARAHATIRARVEAFWSSVRAGLSPQPDHTESSAAAIKAMFPTMRDRDILDLTADDETDAACAGFLKDSAALKEAGKIVAEYKNLIRYALRGAIEAETAGHFIGAKPDKNGKVTLRVHAKPDDT